MTYDAVSEISGVSLRLVSNRQLCCSPSSSSILASSATGMVLAITIFDVSSLVLSLIYCVSCDTQDTIDALATRKIMEYIQLWAESQPLLIELISISIGTLATVSSITNNITN